MPRKPGKVGGAVMPPPVARESACHRGYDRRYQKMRKGMLAAHLQRVAALDLHPCHECAVEGKQYDDCRLQWHHIEKFGAKASSLRLDPANVRWLCESHHSLVSAWEVAIEPGRRTDRVVIYGPPGGGKSFWLQANCPDLELAWDMDDHTDESYGDRDEIEVERLLAKRSAFMDEVAFANSGAWMIFRWPRTAWRYAAELRADRVVLLIDRVAYDQTRRLNNPDCIW